ncbi:MAG: WbuC family cupin fold metalloprotein [Burkholderiales bacterium]|nr:WbuC family cupin fold metalloprotein [Burkholderiales bacterium]
MAEPQFIDATLLDQVSDAAKANPRRRRNHNFHTQLAEPCNRMLNALEPDSYVMPHRHLDPTKDESFVVLRGRFGIVLFDDAGRVTRKAVMAVGGDVLGVTIPHGVFHSVLALEPDSVFFESKAGPYAPLTPDEKASWAPAEGEPGAAAYFDQLRRLFA